METLFGDDKKTSYISKNLFVTLAANARLDEADKVGVCVCVCVCVVCVSRSRGCLSALCFAPSRIVLWHTPQCERSSGTNEPVPVGGSCDGSMTGRPVAGLCGAQAMTRSLTPPPLPGGRREFDAPPGTGAYRRCLIRDDG